MIENNVRIMVFRRIEMRYSDAGKESVYYSNSEDAQAELYGQFDDVLS